MKRKMLFLARTALVVCGVFLLFDQISSQAFAQEGWTVLFQDNFEDSNANEWQLDAGWEVEHEDKNYVLSGSGHTWATLNTEHNWTDYSFKAKVKLIEGSVHLNYRVSDNGRYFIGFHAGGLYLNKETPWDTFYDLTSNDVPHSPNAWYNVEIVGAQNNIKVYVDNVLRLEYTDTNPLLFGRIAFETHESSHCHFDDIAVFGKPPPAPPPGYTWVKSGGPSGGLGYDVRIHPQNKNIMFVTDNPSGVNKSYDAGTTWVQRNEGVTTRAGPSNDGIPIFSLTIDPNNPNIVWAGTQNSGGIYKSTDGGETWVKKNRGITEGNEISFRNFGVHPHNSNIVFAGAEVSTGILGREFDKTKGKIYKTEDGGESWRCVWEGNNLVRFVLFDPTNPDVMYASTGIFDREAFNDVGIGILKSTNGGKRWFQINKGIPNSAGNRFVGFLEIHPTNPQILFAASGNNAKGEGGVFRTTNGGVSWEKVLFRDIFTVVTISSSNPNVVYAGSANAFYRSDDGGDTWHKFQKLRAEYGPPGIRAGVPISAVVDPDDPYTVFVNNYGGGNFKSTDGGQTWVNSSKGYTGADLHDIAIDTDNPTIVYTIGRSGPFKSYNGGEDWTGIAFPPANKAEWNAVALNPDNSLEVIISDEHEGTLLKSTDGGNNWKLVFKLITYGTPQECRHGFKTIAYAPSNPNIVYAGTSKGRRSIDGDFPARPSFGMYKSTNGGETWMEINKGLQTSLININCLAVHPTDPNIVYIGTWKDGVFKTTDGGESWLMKSNGLVSADIRSLAIDPQNPEIVYVGLGEGAGIFKSTNGGELWRRSDTGVDIECPSYLLPIGRVKPGSISLEKPRRAVGADYYSVPWTSIWSIVIDPMNSQTLYAADHHKGVYLSTDGGANWVPISEGLSTKAVTALAISSNGKVLYAATKGEGVFRLDRV